MPKNSHHKMLTSRSSNSGQAMATVYAGNLPVGTQLLKSLNLINLE